MDKRKTEIRFFTIADYEEEEAWLRKQHKEGWKLIKMTPPCFFTFENCKPEDVIYRLDYKNNAYNSNYFQIFKDYGWEYVGNCFGWVYFRKQRSETDMQQDGEIFSDNESRMDMLDHVIKTRLLPLFVIFLFILLPNFFRGINIGLPNRIIFIFFAVMLPIHLYLIIHCSLKLQKLRNKYKTNE